MSSTNIDSSIIFTITICSDSRIHLKGNNNMKIVNDSQSLGDKCMDNTKTWKVGSNGYKSKL